MNNFQEKYKHNILIKNWNIQLDQSLLKELLSVAKNLTSKIQSSLKELSVFSNF